MGKFLSECRRSAGNQVKRSDNLAFFQKRAGGNHGALKDPAFTSAMDKMGALIVSPAKATPDGLKSHLTAEIAKWGPIIKKAGQYAD